MGISVEIQIGRKLREMGDQFQQEHLQMVRVISDQTSRSFFSSRPMWIKRVKDFHRCVDRVGGFIAVVSVTMCNDSIVCCYSAAYANTQRERWHHYWFAHPVYSSSLRFYRMSNLLNIMNTYVYCIQYNLSVNDGWVSPLDDVYISNLFIKAVWLLKTLLFGFN